MSEHHCVLRCWTCGKEVGIVVPEPPKFAFELVQWANDIGWRGVIDMERHRSLVFCSDACMEAAKRKKGGFRARPPKVKPVPVARPAVDPRDQFVDSKLSSPRLRGGGPLKSRLEEAGLDFNDRRPRTGVIMPDVNELMAGLDKAKSDEERRAVMNDAIVDAVNGSGYSSDLESALEKTLEGWGIE